MRRLVPLLAVLALAGCGATRTVTVAKPASTPHSATHSPAPRSTGTTGATPKSHAATLEETISAECQRQAAENQNPHPHHSAAENQRTCEAVKREEHEPGYAAKRARVEAETKAGERVTKREEAREAHEARERSLRERSLREGREAGGNCETMSNERVPCPGEGG
jgi:hypothetical protein